jgi:hypothetical protein
VTQARLPSYKNFFQRAFHLKNLCIDEPGCIFPVISPLLGQLTYLELRCSQFPLLPFPFEAILRDGIHLESLRIQDPPSSQTTSIHFRRYSHCLPHLKRFGISFKPAGSPLEWDEDLFPAICDFLYNKQDLATVELVAPKHATYQTHLGFDRRCWDMLPALDHLRYLSITLTNLDSKHCAQFIPRCVTGLALLGKVRENFLTIVSVLDHSRRRISHKHPTDRNLKCTGRSVCSFFA